MADTQLWRAQVRNFEVDCQGIVNNAFYHTYMDDARVDFLAHHHLDVLAYAQKDLHIVVTSCEVQFKSPLKWRDHIFVETSLHKTQRKLVVQFKQIVYTQRDNKKIICATGDNYVCAVKQGKAIFLEELYNMAL